MTQQLPKSMPESTPPMVVREMWRKYRASFVFEPDSMAVINPYEAYRHAISIQQRFGAGEPAMAMDAKISYLYALEIVKGRFELGEPAIAQSAGYSYYYAVDVLNNERFWLGEPAVASDPYYAHKYALNVIKGRWEAGEEAITKVDEYTKAYLKLLNEG